MGNREKAASHCVEGERLAGLGKIDEAIEAFVQATSIDPSFANAYLGLGFLLRQQGRTQEAITGYRQAITVQPDFFQAHFNLGNALKEQGDLQEAASCFHKVLSINPGIAEAHNSLGNIFAEQQRWQEAVASFQQALALNPDFAGAANNLGLALRQQGRAREAEAQHRAAIRSAPDFAMAHLALSDLLRNSGRIGEAEKYAEDAVRLAAASAEAHYTLGLARMEMKKFDAAAQSFGKAIGLKPGHAQAHNKLGNALKKLGRLDDALPNYRKAIALAADDAEAYNNLGLALKDMGQLDDALASYRQAIAVAPDQTALWNNLKFVAKALQFQQQGKSPEIADLAEYNSAQFALLDYYLNSFQPHQAEESFDKAMAALPAAADERVSIPETQRRPRSSHLPGKLIALLQFGRSGTGLLHSLIDDHPEISTLPGIYLRGLFNAGVWDHITAEGWRKIPERFADMFAVLFDATCPEPTPGRIAEVSFFLGESEGMTRVGENRDQGLLLDRDKFISEALALMQGFDNIDPASFLLVVHAAFEAARGAAGGKDIAFYHIHNPDDYAKANFLRYAPHARLVMMVREPLQSCESWIRERFEDNNYTSVVLRISEMLLAIDQVAFRKRDAVGVRLEDLKERPEETLRSLSAWLGVEESPSLYVMTAQGEKWWGDPTSPAYDRDQGMAAFGPTTSPAPVFSEQDRLVLGTLYYPFSVRFGYRQADAGGFENDLREIRPLLDDLLDFEKVMAQRSGIDPAILKRSGSCLLFRAALLERWQVANAFKDYPHMLRPLALP